MYGEGEKAKRVAKTEARTKAEICWTEDIGYDGM